MTEINLLGLDDNDLIRLQDELRRVIELREEKKMQDALQNIKSLIEENDISIEQVKKLYEVEKVPAEVKYRDTSDPSNTWSGRGKRPKWLTTAIENGFSIESFLIS